MALTVSAIACGGSRRPQGGAAELLAALGPRRPVEPRLAGQTAYALCRPVPAVLGKVPDALCSALPRSGSADWNALAKVARQLHDLRHPTAQEIQAQGIGKLLQRRQEGKADEAVETLRRASAAAPKDARIWSDLAAAYYVRAQQENEPQDLLFGLSAAGTAVDLASAMPEALFNRALLLDRLYLRGEAETAWKRYLEVDAKSPWAAEAQAHLRELAAPSTPELWRRQLPALRQAALAGEDGRVQAMIAVSPQAAREYAVEEVLGGWGRDVLAVKAKEAAEALRVAEGIGKALAARGGDGTVAEAVAVIAQAGGEPAVRERLARGHQAYAAGSASLRALDAQDALSPLLAARDSLESSGSPVSRWAEVGLAGVTFYGARYEPAATEFRRVLDRADSRRFPALAARASWGLGLSRLRQGRLSEALVAYRAAAGLFSGLGEAENLAAIHDMTGETFFFLGDRSGAWKHRYEALALLRSFRASLRLHNLLWQIGDAAREEIDPQVALVVQDEGVRVAESTGNPSLLAESLLWRSKIQALLGSFDAALTDLRQADTQHAADRGVGEKLRVDLAVARAEVERQRDPRRAVELFREPVAFYQARDQALDLATAYLSRGRSAFAAQDLRQAGVDFDAAIDLFERKRGEIEGDGLRLSYSETVQGLFDERILLALVRREPSEAILRLAERARTVPFERLATDLAERPPARVFKSSLEERLARLPAAVAFVEYAWLPDRLLRWTVRREGVTLEPDVIDSAVLSARIQAFTSAVQAGSEEGIARTSATLYENLLPKAARGLSPGVQVYFVPDKLLFEVPFAALKNPVNGLYLIEEHAAVGVVPSLRFYLDTLDRPRSEPGRWTALLVSNPAFDRSLFHDLVDLPASAAEVSEVRKLYPQADILTGPSATKAALLALLDRHEVLEYAGHALDDPKYPSYSRLVLASAAPDSGSLFAHEIAARPFKRLRLVILSACHTISARNLRIGGLAGIARPFLDAGAQGVLGTLWDVEDRAAREILPEFHRQLRRTGDAPVALREAQLACIRRHGGAGSPRAWGAFQILGAV